MKHIVPGYYKDFRCIADKCKHNCCIGWEIDIDEDTYEYYRSVQGDFGKILHSGIDHNTCSFKLGTDERCVFLNEKGLCDIILNLGEDSLCGICNDHPRFRNFFSDREEVGLGLCCEEACRIILSGEKTEFLESEDDVPGESLTEDEKEFLEHRTRAIDILQDRNVPLERNKELPGKTFMETMAFYREMERLSPEWDKFLDETEESPSNYRLPENIARQLAVYFMYRHGSLKMALHAVGFVEAVCGAVFNSPGFEDICEVCRMYSCEIEYSDINIERLSHCIPD